MGGREAGDERDGTVAGEVDYGTDPVPAILGGEDVRDRDTVSGGLRAQGPAAVGAMAAVVEMERVHPGCGAASPGASSVEVVVGGTVDGAGLPLSMVRMRAVAPEGVVAPVVVGPGSLLEAWRSVADAAGLGFGVDGAGADAARSLRLERRLRVGGPVESVLEVLRQEAAGHGRVPWAVVEGGAVRVAEHMMFRVRGEHRADGLVAVAAAQRAGAEVLEVRRDGGSHVVDVLADAGSFGMLARDLAEVRDSGEAAWVDLWTSSAPEVPRLLLAPASWREAELSGAGLGDGSGGLWMRARFDSAPEALGWARGAGALFGEGRAAAWSGEAVARMESRDCRGLGGDGILELRGSPGLVEMEPVDERWPFGRVLLRPGAGEVFVWGDGSGRRLAVVRLRMIRGVGRRWAWTGGG